MKRKGIQKINAKKLNKKLIREVEIRDDKVKIYSVNGTYIRDGIYQDWTQGGHRHVSENYHFIPDKEIYIDSNLNEKDHEATILHEITEYELMKFKGMDYDKAHDKSNEAEKEFRDEFKNTLTEGIDYIRGYKYYEKSVEERKEWIDIKEANITIDETNYFLATKAIFKYISKDEFDKIDAGIYQSNYKGRNEYEDRRSLYKIKDKFVYRYSDHWLYKDSTRIKGIGSCVWYLEDYPKENADEKYSITMKPMAGKVLFNEMERTGNAVFIKLDKSGKAQSEPTATQETTEHSETFEKIQKGEIKTAEDLGQSIAEDHLNKKEEIIKWEEWTDVNGIKRGKLTLPDKKGFYEYKIKDDQVSGNKFGEYSDISMGYGIEWSKDFDSLDQLKAFVDDDIKTWKGDPNYKFSEEQVVDVHNKILDNEPLTDQEKEIWLEEQYAPEGYFYDLFGNIQKKVETYKNLINMIPENKRFSIDKTIITHISSGNKFVLKNYDEDKIYYQKMPRFQDDEIDYPMQSKTWDNLYRSFADGEISILGYNQDEAEKLNLVISYYKGEKTMDKTKSDADKIKAELDIKQKELEERKAKLHTKKIVRRTIEEEREAEEKRIESEKQEKQDRKQSLELRSELLNEMIAASKGSKKSELKLRLELINEMLNEIN